MSARVILVHGAFHGAWCWSRVVDGLRALDVEVTALDLPGHGESRAPLSGLSEHVGAVRAEIAAGDQPIVLCGHSYGGSVITEAADAAHPVDHLVYLAAAVPSAGESMLGCFPEVENGAIADATIYHDDGVIAIDPRSAGRIFYQDCDDATAQGAIGRLGRQRLASLLEATREPAWRSVDSTYVVCSEDQAIPPVAQERMAKRCGQRVSWDTGHSPMLSRPELLISLLSQLALDL